MSCTSDDDTVNLLLIENQKPLGSSSRDLLSNEFYNRLTVEIVAVEGYQPSAKAIEGFTAFLQERLHKPDGIDIRIRNVASSKTTSFTLQKIKQIEDKTRKLYTKEDHITVFIYIADGRYAGDTSDQITLGSAYRNTSIVVYGETLRTLASLTTSPSISTIENAVLNHEFTHLLGLLNIGHNTTHTHENPAHKGHCDVSGCLMEATMQFPSQMMEVLGKGVPVLDPKCIAALQQLGGK